MKQYFFFIFIFILNALQLFAIDAKSLKKYPHQLITNDYGILNENNLKKYVNGIISRPFDGNITGFDYWQCFPKKYIKVWYDKGVYDPYDNVIRSDPHISVNVSFSLKHEYEPRRNFSIYYAREKVKRWKNLMKNQKYVCIGGAFAGSYKTAIDGQEITQNVWMYENLKTKKGCDSYFSGWCS